jgi:Ca2+-binding RTX toxin-like protein
MLPGDLRDYTATRKGTDYVLTSPTTSVTTINVANFNFGWGESAVPQGDGPVTQGGGFGDNILFGTISSDYLAGGDGNDTLLGGGGDDTIYGGSGGNDVIDGGGGAQNLITLGDGQTLNSGANTVYAGKADFDDITGGSGADRFVLDAAVLQRGTYSVALRNLTAGDVIDLTSMHLSDMRFVQRKGVYELEVATSADFNDFRSIAMLAGINRTDVLNVRYQNLGGIITTKEVTFLDVKGFVANDPVLTTGSTGDNLINNISGTYDGSAGDDTLKGSTRDNALSGGFGRDSLDGAGGSDTLDGGFGDDVIVKTAPRASKGSLLLGGYGDDQLSGGDGNDTLDGGVGADSLGGSGGADSLNGGSGDDRLVGSFGGATLDGGAGNDTLNPGDARGGNLLRGGAGADSIVSGGGVDTLIGGTGADTLSGGSGDYFAFAKPDGSVDVIQGFAWSSVSTTIDLRSAFGASVPVGPKIDLVRGLLSENDVLLQVDLDGYGSEYGWETLANLGRGDGTSQIWTLLPSGSGYFNVTVGYQSGEVILESSGSDVIVPGFAAGSTSRLNDTVIAGGGDDSVDGGLGDDSLDGGTGNDTLLGGGSSDTLLGGTGNDSLSGGTGSDRLDGGAGSDTLRGWIGADIFVASSPRDGPDRIMDWEAADVVDLSGLATVQGIGLSSLDANSASIDKYARALFDSATNEVTIQFDADGAFGPAAFQNIFKIASSDAVSGAMVDLVWNNNAGSLQTASIQIVNHS